MSDGMDRVIEKPRKRRTALAAGAALAAVLLVAGAAGISTLAKPTYRAPADTLEFGTVERASFHDITPLRAKVEARDLVYLDALEGGRVAEVFVKNGDEVRAGQPLVKFQNTELELEVLDREGRLVESITELQAYAKQLEDTRVANAKAAAEIAYNIVRLDRDTARNNQLYQRGFVSTAARDQSSDELTYNRRLEPLQAEANRRQDALIASETPRIKGELASLNESLRITRGKLDDLTVKAPVSGRLADMDLHVGQIKPRGERLGQITGEGGMKLVGTVDEFYLNRVRVGQTAQVTTPDGTVTARISRVDPTVKDSVFSVELEFVGPSPKGLLPGQQLDGKLTLGGDSTALVAPTGAFLETTGGDWVMVMSSDGRHAERRAIHVGRRNAGQVEITDGLKAGDRIIISDYRAFQKVERVDIKR